MDTTSVHVISQEILKPSSQTPNQLKYHKLSLLDQIAPPVYIPLIFFYQANDLNGHDTNHQYQISENLKRSLSQTLTKFYPLAGKLDRQNSVVDCNDEGVKYIEARVHARMSDIVQDPRAEQLKHYLPVSTADVNDNVFLAVQVNFFQCGGIAIGVCLSHYVADGVSTATFVNSWAATCRGDDQVQTPRPSFDLADHFPSRDLSGSIISMSGLMVDGELLATKRFVFDKEKLAALRKNATSSGSIKDPTRVELVSAFIWKSFVHVAKSKESSNTIATAASQVVNLRNRTKSMENVFGNCIMNPGAIYGYDHKGVPKYLHDLVPQFRTKIRSINNEYIEKSKNIEEDVYVKECEKALELLFTGGVDYCGFTSWCRFPFYEVDYGWGKPVWVGTPGFPMMNYTVLMDTKSGDGVEAWVSTLRDNVESLESHFGLLKGAMGDGL